MDVVDVSSFLEGEHQCHRLRRISSFTLIIMVETREVENLELSYRYHYCAYSIGI